MDRKLFLERVAGALRDGPEDGGLPLPEAFSGSWDGPADREKMIALFTARLEELGGKAMVAPTRQEALAQVAEALAAAGTRSLACAPELKWEAILDMWTDDARAAGFGLSEAAWGIADTGTVVVRHGGDHGRAYSLVPPAVGFLLPVSRLVPRMGLVLAAIGTDPGGVPACVTFVSGVSHSGDIAGVTCTGVHGPGDVRVWLIGDE